MEKEDLKKLIIVSIFAIAMGFLEAVIVIYLRKLYYPAGFNFPLAAIETSVLNIEWIREFFTIVMLACIGLLVGKKFYEKFAYFLFAFATWDIFYYIWLKVALNWPSSLMTWDLLFLIPWPWIGPVLALIICSITMVVFSLFIIQFKDDKKLKIKTLEWCLLVLGSIIILYTFLSDYGSLIIKNNYLKDFFTLATNKDFQNLVYSYIPVNYNWILFLIGEILILAAIGLFYWRNRG